MPRLEYTVFCDDIREEAGNKVTLVGVYGKYLFLPRNAQFPSALRQLCLFMRWSGVKGGESLSLAMYYKGEKLFSPQEPSALRQPLTSDEFSNVSLYIIPFPMKGFGTYKFEIGLDGEPKTDVQLEFGPEPDDLAKWRK